MCRVSPAYRAFQNSTLLGNGYRIIDPGPNASDGSPDLSIGQQELSSRRFRFADRSVAVVLLSERDHKGLHPEIFLRSTPIPIDKFVM